MIRKAFLNQYGLMVYIYKRTVCLLYNGDCIKLNKYRVDLNGIDSVKFYELYNDNDDSSKKC